MQYLIHCHANLRTHLRYSDTSLSMGLTCKMVKFSSTLFIMYFSGRCLSLWMKLIMYSHMGERWIRYRYLPPSIRAYSVWWDNGNETWSNMKTVRIDCCQIFFYLTKYTDYTFKYNVIWAQMKWNPLVLTSTFSTTCLPKEQTFVETVIVMFSELLYWLLTP